MADISGTFSQETRSSDSPTDLSRALPWVEALLLIGAGVVAVVLHKSFRMPLHLPGRQGIVWIAVLITARSLAHLRFAGGLVGASAAATAVMPFWGPLDDPFVWLTYLLPGFVVDGAFRYLPRLSRKIWFLAMLGAAAHVTKPLTRAVIAAATGWPYSSFISGFLYPVATHLLFGLIGGLLGALLVTGYRRSKGVT